MPCLLISVFK